MERVVKARVHPDYYLFYILYIISSLEPEYFKPITLDISAKNFS